MIPRVAKLGTGFVGAGMYYMNDKRDAGLSVSEARRPSAADYFLSDKGPAQTAKRVGFTATRNVATDDPMKALRQMAFTAAHAHDIRVAAVAAAARAAGMSYDAYVKAANPFRGRKGSKPVYSLSLAWEPGDKSATRETMLKAADEVRHRLGLQDHQCVIIEHTDTAHPHVHLVINRVHPTTGKYASVANDRLKLSEWALEWEQRYGKVVCPARVPNQKKRAENRDRKAEARARGDRTAKAGYVKNKGLPPSEIEFWMTHGSANLSAVRAARAERQKRDYENYRRITAWKLQGVDLHHERANGRALGRIDRSLCVLKGQAPVRTKKQSATVLGLMFGAVRGAAMGIVARIANRSDIAKLEKIKTQLRKERDVRRAEVLAERRQAFQKMQRIHAWQNRLDEQRCKTYRDSDTRDWRARRDRWDITKVKPPLFGSVHMTFYDVDQKRDWRRAAEDRLNRHRRFEMTPIPRQPDGPSRNELPFIKRDSEKHAAEVAERARRRAAERAAREQSRTRNTGRKRRPRPR
ncbi:MAG: relaxase/mobilization nuclease domain-containing protein [Hyphomicrobiaceae bacterium]|nr:relaxase/mobilization nuclease domain-containing protein [Hyphomicrobiaceae bacterium]